MTQFKTKEELYSYLRQNKSLLMLEKKQQLKHADTVSACLYEYAPETPEAKKAAIDPEVSNDNFKSFKIAVVINTTNLMDSHGDVHIPGLWKKSLQEQKNLYLLQEHKMQFDKIISDNVKASVKTMGWAELGYDYEGTTQALIFNAEVEKDRNEYMATQYLKDRVRNHSVGMRYVTLSLAMNSESKYDREEKETWDKYIKQVANKEEAEAQGYFWVVTEAKIVEGSAVPLGSNTATPTLSVGKEPIEITPEPEQPLTKRINWDKTKLFINQQL